MPRILGVDIPNDKRTVISLRYIYGIGPFLAEQLCERAGIDPEKRARDLSEDDLAKLAGLLDNEFTVKKLYYRAGRMKLRAGNPTYPDIIPRDGQDLEVWGVVTSCIKQFML